MSHASISHRCAEVVPKLGIGGEPLSTLGQGLLFSCPHSEALEPLLWFPSVNVFSTVGTFLILGGES